MNKEISIKNARLIKISYAQTYQLCTYNFPLRSQFQVFVNEAMHIRLELNPPFLCAIGNYTPNLQRSEQPRLLSQVHYLESLAIMMVCTMFLVTCASHYSYISPQLLCYTCIG